MPGIPGGAGPNRVGEFYVPTPATGPNEILLASVAALPLSGSVVLANAIVLGSTAALPIGGSVVLANAIILPSGIAAGPVKLTGRIWRTMSAIGWPDPEVRLDTVQMRVPSRSRSRLQVRNPSLDVPDAPMHVQVASPALIVPDAPVPTEWPDDPDDSWLDADDLSDEELVMILAAL